MLQFIVAEDTEALLREQVQLILKFGVTQRALADRLNVSETWLSRWLKASDSVRPINVNEMDRFRAYVREFRESMDALLEETQRATAPSSATAGGDFRATGTTGLDRRVADGPPPGGKDRRKPGS